MPKNKLIVLVGSSSQSWEDAVRQVVAKAAQSVGQIHRVDVVQQSAHVEGGEIVEFRATVHLTFEIEGAS